MPPETGKADRSLSDASLINATRRKDGEIAACVTQASQSVSISFRRIHEKTHLLCTPTKIEYSPNILRK